MLLSRHGVSGGRLVVVNEHTELDRMPYVLELLGDGMTVAVVSDAGSPGISDPGERLVAAALDAGYEVSAIPGPSAVVMGLSISGLPTGRFVFEGFLPRSGSGRAERLAEVAGERRTIVLYEAPHRLARTLAELRDACGPERRVALARELTKLHEELWRGTLGEAVEHAAQVAPLGEYVIVLAGAPAEGPADDDTIRAALRERLAAGRHDQDGRGRRHGGIAGVQTTRLRPGAEPLDAERRPVGSDVNMTGAEPDQPPTGRWPRSSISTAH